MLRQLRSIDDLCSPATLGEIVGAVQAIERTPLTTVGFSQARLERVSVQRRDRRWVHFILKRFTPAATWTAYRTGDTVGREAALLLEPALAGVWGVFRNPYRGFALEGGEVGLLMEDLSAILLPDDATPMTSSQEDALLRSLAALHARYWESEALSLAWLAPLAARFHILHPTSGREEMARPDVAPVFALVHRGWELALRNVPARLAELLQQPAEVTASQYVHLPQTLLHGDTKIANFGFGANGEIAAFDWATMGRGPSTVDLGYCLAINAARFARPREDVIARYRAFLAAMLEAPPSDELWHEMVTAAIVAGAGMLLWSKALAVESGSPGAAVEWTWWVTELERRLG